MIAGIARGLAKNISLEKKSASAAATDIRGARGASNGFASLLDLAANVAGLAGNGRGCVRNLS